MPRTRAETRDEMISGAVGSPSEAATRLSDDAKANAQRPAPNTEMQSKENTARNKVGRTSGLNEQKQTKKKKGERRRNKRRRGQVAANNVKHLQTMSAADAHAEMPAQHVHRG